MLHPRTLLKRLLVQHGAPAGFQFHGLRHSMASHFPRASDFEVGLLLNHAGSGSVTQGYRHQHDHTLSVKAELLQTWADTTFPDWTNRQAVKNRRATWRGSYMPDV